MKTCCLTLPEAADLVRATLGRCPTRRRLNLLCQEENIGRLAGKGRSATRLFTGSEVVRLIERVRQAQARGPGQPRKERG